MRYKQELIKCLCGCGQLRPKYDSHNREHKYIKGHGNRNKELKKGIDRKKHEHNPNFKYKKCIDKDGYIRINKKLEHRSIIEKHLDRDLNKNEVVHHKNKNRQDNRIENLIPKFIPEHIKEHNIKDMSNRKCIRCNSKETNKRHWYKYKNGFICNKCYHRLKRNNLI